MSNGDHRELKLRGAAKIARHQLIGSTSISGNRQQVPGWFAAINPNNPMARITSMTERDLDKLSVQGAGVFAFIPNHRMSVDVRYSQQSNRSEPVREDGANDGTLRNTNNNDIDNLSLSAEYSTPRSSALSASVAAVHAERSTRRTSVLVTEDTHRSSIVERRSGETAARAGLRWQPSNELTLGAELSAALNTLKGDTQVFENGVERSITGSSADVTEPRAGMGMTFQWRPTPRLVFQGGAGVDVYETKTARASSGRQQDPIGRLAASLNLRPRTSLTIETEHAVEQVSFNQFLASSSLAANTVTEGAANLAPPRTWRHSVTFDHRFDDKGVFDVTVSRATTENPINAVPVSDVVVVAQNTAPQTLDTLSSRLSLPLDNMGFAGAILDVTGSLVDSSAIDPVTGDVRPVSGVTRSSWSVAFSKEPDDTTISWGIGVSNQERERTFAARMLSRIETEPAWNGFIEWSPQPALTLRTSIRGPSRIQTTEQIFPGIRESGGIPGFVSDLESKNDVLLSGSLEWRPAGNIELTLSAATGRDMDAQQLVTAVGAIGEVPVEQRLPATPSIGLQLRITN